MPEPFVHLHVHSQYSLLDGANRIGDLVRRAKELEQPAIAITDHGCLFGVIDFYTQAVAEGVKPILGIEAYMAPGSRHDRTSTGVKDGGYHLLLLAENLTGYANLLKLASIAYTQGFYYKPRIDKEALADHSDGLICTSACLGGEIPVALMQDDRKKAKELAEFYLGLFGPDRFFIELQKHIPEQDKANPELMDLADRLGIGCVASNDVHFLLEDDHAPHDALCCISTGKLVSDEHRMKYPTQLYLKSSEQMYAAMDHPKWADACANTLHVAEMCNLELDFSTSHTPVVKIDRVDLPTSTPKNGKSKPTPDSPPTGSTEWYKAFCAQYHLEPFDKIADKDLSAEDLKAHCDTALRELAEAGLTWRYGDEVTDEHRARLNRELGILADKNISAYFLIVWDFVNEARRRGMPCGARGSGVGTMVGYCLGLSNACPVKYGLLFERFTDPDRNEYPDIDIDICQDGRQEIIDYVRQKYGHVAQIITFGSLKARAAIRDVGRVLNVSLGDVDKVCKLVGDGLGTTLDQALEQEPDLKELYDENPQHKQMIDTARRLEGLSRHAGVHAAGVVIATEPLDRIVPLYQPPGTDQVVTQWDGPTVEKVGLLKMDFLGLRTLSIIERARELILKTFNTETIRRTTDPKATRPDGWDPLDLERITYDDQDVLDLFRRGETAGVFQFESGGMRNLLMSMRPDRFEDLIAANALFRPGPMALIDDYCARKHGQQEVPQTHPIVDHHTAETYGIMVYQEQVMQIVHELGEIPLRAAYTLIKAISKKKRKVIDANRAQFLTSAQEKGLSVQQAEELFDLILKFAGYGFNKSHSTGYAIVAYQTAYLKTYFPVQYMTAVLTYESVNTDKVVEYIDECKKVRLPDGRRGIPVRPPDISLSHVDFTDVFEPEEQKTASHGHIRFGLSAVKGVGEKAIQAVIDAREKGGSFKSLFDFTDRVPLGTVNRTAIDALVKCGAFDSIHSTQERAAMVDALEAAIQAGQRAAEDRSSGQMNFFESLAADPTDANEPAPTSPQITLPRVDPWSNRQLLEHEKAVLGFYVSSHPLDEYHELLDRCTTTTTADIRGLAAGVEIYCGGLLTRVRSTIVRTGRSAGKKMAMITLEDPAGSIDGVVFSDLYAANANQLQPDRIVILKCKVDRRRAEPAITVDEVIPIDDASARLTKTVKITLDQASPTADAYKQTSDDPDELARLNRLKQLLRDAGAHAGRDAANVCLELVDNGYLATFRLDGIRVSVSPDFAERVATVLDQKQGCTLMGPAKIKPSTSTPSPDSQLAFGNEPPPPAQKYVAPEKPIPVVSVSQEQETCASIDRY